MTPQPIYTRRRAIIAKSLEPAAYAGGPVVIAKPVKRKPGRPRKNK